MYYFDPFPWITGRDKEKGAKELAYVQCRCNDGEYMLELRCGSVFFSNATRICPTGRNLLPDHPDRLYVPSDCDEEDEELD